MKTKRLTLTLVAAAVAFALAGVARAGTPPTSASPITIAPQPLDEAGGTVQQDSTVAQPGALPGGAAPGTPGAPGNSTTSFTIPPGGSNSGSYIENAPPPAQIGDALADPKLCFDPVSTTPLDTVCTSTFNTANELIETNTSTGRAIAGSVHLVEFTGELYWNLSWHSFDIWCGDQNQVQHTCQTAASVGPFTVSVSGNNVDGSGSAWQVVGAVTDVSGARID